MASAEEPSGARAFEAGGESELTAETLRRLEERLDRASEAAERLIAEAAAAALRKPPPAGWERREPDREQDPDATTSLGSASEIELLLEALRALRDRIPPELQRRLGEALREVLLALRALIDWYLERTDRQRDEPTEARDIPIL